MDISAVAKLANLSLSTEELKLFSSQLPDTLEHITVINELNTSQVEPTSQVTGLTNVTRPDEIDQNRILPPPPSTSLL